jgi:sucrose-6-phosphate hydrolase SacC (GH32 family)
MKTAVSTVACLAALAAASPSSAIAQNEPWRPHFHFTPAKNWMNDPNGMVYHDGEWHLFYQYNPFGDRWGHMSWGHAVSRDLLRWEHLPLALAEEDGVMVFSGSAVVDATNTSGFGEPGRPPLVAIYTGHTEKNQSQCIAYSKDRGRTWTKYSGNPVLDIGEKDFRDPKVQWHEPSRRWVMTVAWPVQRKVRFYASPDLKTWTHLSDFGPAGSVTGIWECPDLLPLEVDGDPAAQAWVLIVNAGSGAPAGGSGGQYFIGAFDGKAFTLDTASQPRARPAVEPLGAVIADFEGADYGGWKASGDCFGSGPARGRLDGQQPVSGFRGKGLVNTFLKGDGPQGTLTSPPFTIDRGWLSFLIGGGGHPGKTCVNLLVEGSLARTAAGRDAEALEWHAWRVEELRGRQAVLEIVDAASDGWGHVNADHFVLADAPARPAAEGALWLDHGPDFYAGVTWSGAPAGDRRRILLGWMSNWQYAQDVPTRPWRSSMSVPRELSLRRTADGVRLFQQPVRETAALHETTRSFAGGTLVEANAWLQSERIASTALDLTVTLVPDAAGECAVDVLADDTVRTRTGLDAARRMLYVDRTRSGATGFHPRFPARAEAPLSGDTTEPVTLRLVVDACSVEAFAADGAVVVTALAFPPPGARQVRIAAAASVTAITARSLDESPTGSR